MPTARQRGGAAKRKTKKKGSHDTIERSTRISDVLARMPNASEIFAVHGLHCAGCQFNESDSLEEGAALHGMSEDALEDLLADLRSGTTGKLVRLSAISMTKEAAEALRETLEEAGKVGWKLLVMTDESGGFCMEFARKKTHEHTTFTHPDVPGVELVATEATLASIGGSTIDHRDGRFKLDLPQTISGCACEKDRLGNSSA